MGDHASSAAPHDAAHAVELLVLDPASVPAPVERLSSGLGVPLRRVAPVIDEAIGALEELARRGAEGIVVAPRALLGDLASVDRLLRAGAADLLAAEDSVLAALLDDAITRAHERVAKAAALADAGLVGDSPAMRRVRWTLAEGLADGTVPVLLLGDTGTGKCLAARAIHAADKTRAGQPFHSLDCGSVTDTLFGSELFGHVRGAFTGALEGRAGAIATAAGGTLLLDEVAELTPVLQATFLTALQERIYRPVGADVERPIRCRVVAATNRDLEAQVAGGAFRADLFYRLDGIRIYLPSLANRREDIPKLFRTLVGRHHGEESEVVVDPDVDALLVTRPWPGNVRELETVARRCAAAAGRTGRIRLAHVARSAPPPSPSRESRVPAIAELVASGCGLGTIVATTEREAVRRATEIAERVQPGGSRRQVVETAARLLRVSPRTVWKRLGERIVPTPTPNDAR